MCVRARDYLLIMPNEKKSEEHSSEKEIRQSKSDEPKSNGSSSLCLRVRKGLKQLFGSGFSFLLTVRL